MDDLMRDYKARKLHADVEDRLAQMKQLVAEGKFEIANEAAKAGGDAVVVTGGYWPQVDSHGLVFQWSRDGVGFGELTLRAKDGKLVADTENMSDEFCLGVLRQALAERRERE